MVEANDQLPRYAKVRDQPEFVRGGSQESRRLLGPDTPTLRLYEVEARNHRFGGAHDRMIADVDDALRWILAAHASRPAEK